MARAKDVNKRAVIVQSCKGLFARNGFVATSISDIVRETGFPVGTIYTYFKCKEDIVRAITDEGWAELDEKLSQLMHSAGSDSEKLGILIEKFLPELLHDLDLIQILLGEAVRYTRIGEKLDKITEIIAGLIQSTAHDPETLRKFPFNTLKAGLLVYFLGIMNAVRICRTATLGVGDRDILDFVTRTVEESLVIRLKKKT
jgi:AcrR family transcriptional regulator